MITFLTKGQAREIVEKIDDLRKNSPNLQREISDIKTGSNDPKVEFHNGSWIKVVAANDNARSKYNCIYYINKSIKGGTCNERKCS